MNKSFQSALHLARAELESLYEGSTEGILVADTGTRQIVRGNRAMCELLGYSAVEWTSLSIVDIHPSESLPQVLEILEVGRRCGSTRTATVPCLRKDGAIVYVELAVSHFGGSDQPQIIAFFRPATEAARPVERWRAGDHRYQFMLEYSIEGFAVIDMEGRIREVNSAYCEMLGYTRVEMLAKHVADIEMVRSAAEIAAHIQMVRRTGAARFETKHRRKDGTAVDVDATVHYCRLGHDEFLFAFLRDVSDRNQAERALRENERRYRLITDNVGDVIWTGPFGLSGSEREAAKESVAGVVDAILDRWRFSFVSPTVARVFGYTPEEMVAMSLRDMTTPASYARIREAMIADFGKKLSETESGHQQHVIEAEFRMRDGSLRWCESVSTYLRDDNGRPVGILGITRDISERRKAERALRESEGKLRSLLENLPDLVFALDRNGIIQFVNRDSPEMAREQLEGVCGFDFLIPEHREQCRAALDRAFATDVSQTIESQDVFGRWWRSRLASLLKEGDSDHAMIICTDITQERLAMEAVNKEQRLLRQLLELHD